MVGHGFDYNDNFRDMLHVCIINQHGIDKFKQNSSSSSKTNDEERDSGGSVGSGED